MERIILYLRFSSLYIVNRSIFLFPVVKNLPAYSEINIVKLICLEVWGLIKIIFHPTLILK